MSRAIDEVELDRALNAVVEEDAGRPLTYSLPPDYERMIVTLAPGLLPAALMAIGDVLAIVGPALGIFQRGGSIVRVIRIPAALKNGALKRPEGAIMLDALNPTALIDVFEQIVMFQKYQKLKEGADQDKKPVAIPAGCPKLLAAAFLERRGMWRIPVLTGIIGAPILRGDGSILSRPGFDRSTGLYLATEQDWPAIPEAPTREDAREATKLLLEPFSQFPFVTPPDRSVLVSAILTALQRRLLGACPLHAFSAPTMRYGKSLLVDGTSIIATGHNAPATALSVEGEEIRKAVLSVLREGHLLVSLDNCDRTISSPWLAMAITQATYSDRVLGESKNLSLDTNVLWLANGNNLSFARDMSARVILCQIDAGMEKPEERVFKIPNLPEYLLAHRKELVCAALTVLKAYHAAGRPSQNLKAWGGFDQWSDEIRSALVWCGLADPCITREAILDDDPERSEATAAFTELSKAFEGREFSLREAVTRAKAREKKDDSELVNKSLHDALLNVVSDGVLASKQLGWWARRWKNRVLCGLQLQRRGAGGSAKWAVKAHGTLGGRVT